MSTSPGLLRSRDHSWYASLALALALGGAWGLLCRLGAMLPASSGRLVTLVGPWLLVAFVVGRASPVFRHGAMWGVLALGVATAVYYGTMLLMERLVNWDAVLRSGGLRLLVVLPSGAIFGAAGACWGRGGHWLVRTAALAMLSGSLVGESVLGLTRLYDPTQAPVLIGELLFGAMLLLFFVRGHRETLVGLVLTLGFAVMAIGAGTTLLAALRAFAGR